MRELLVVQSKWFLSKKNYEIGRGDYEKNVDW